MPVQQVLWTLSRLHGFSRSIAKQLCWYIAWNFKEIFPSLRQVKGTESRAVHIGYNFKILWQCELFAYIARMIKVSLQTDIHPWLNPDASHYKVLFCSICHRFTIISMSNYSPELISLHTHLLKGFNHAVIWFNVFLAQHFNLWLPLCF